jgi:tetratricopeptide (TPR) repeat protein
MAQACLDAGYHSDALELLKTTFSNPAASTEARAEAHYLAGLVHTAAGSHSGAAAAFREALGLTPQKPGLAAALAQALHRAGNPAQAAEAMRRETQADTPEAHARAAQAWLEAGDAAAALASFDAALKLSPGSPALEFGRASALEKVPGRAAEAIAVYRRLSKLPEAANNLAWILSTHPSESLRDPAASLQLATKLTALTARQNPGVLDTLAAATAASGDLPAAARIAAEARTLALATGQFPLARDLANRITVYQAGKAFIDPAYR